MTQPTIAQLHNLTDRAATGLTPDEQQRLRDGIDHLHQQAEAAEHQPPPATTQPSVTHTHTWTGTHLPAWTIDHHHWDNDQPIIHTPDGDTPLQPGWCIALWTDGTVTVGSPTTAQRVYGPDGIRGQLERAEAELRRHAEQEAALDGEQPAGTRHVHVTIRHPDPGAADRAALSLADWIREQFPAHHVTTDAAEGTEPAQSGSTPGCDCGHDGMGVSWHGDDCLWRRSVVDCPGRPTPA